MNKHIRMYGDATSPRFHTFRGVDDRLTRILAGYAVHGSEDYPALTEAALADADLVVWYIDAWETRGTREAAAALLAYVARGGRLLTLHGSIIMHDAPELEAMHAGAFTHHPAMCELAFTPRGDHPMAAGVAPFALAEEPYRFAMDPLMRPDVFLTYAHGGEVHPAAWTHPFGLGRVAYLCIGHTPESFDPPDVQRLVRNMAEELLRTPT